MGAGVARRRGRHLRRVAPHPRGDRARSSATSTTSSRCRRASTSTGSLRRSAARRSPGCSPKQRDDEPNPGNAEERLPDQGNAERLEAFFATDAPTVVYFGKLIRNKGVHLLLEALEGLDVRAVDRRLRRLPGGSGGPRGRVRRARPLHRPARAPASRPPAAACGRGGRAVDLPGGVRDGRSRGRRVRLPAARRAPHRARGDRRRARGRRIPPIWRISAASRPAMSPTSARRSSRSSALSPEDRAALQSAARRTVVERWSWGSVAAQLLAPVA